MVDNIRENDEPMTSKQLIFLVNTLLMRILLILKINFLEIQSREQLQKQPQQKQT